MIVVAIRRAARAEMIANVWAVRFIISQLYLVVEGKVTVHVVMIVNALVVRYTKVAL
jgi:hypothetical protein